MAVFVDDMHMVAQVGRIRASWCHLVADTEEELHTLAQNIGLKRGWFQQGSGLPHYDVTERMRARAIAAGAREIDREEFVAMLNIYRAAESAAGGR